MSPIRNANGIETANQTSLHLLKHSFHVGNCKGPNRHLLVQPDVTHNVQNADTCRSQKPLTQHSGERTNISPHFQSICLTTECMLSLASFIPLAVTDHPTSIPKSDKSTHHGWHSKKSSKRHPLLKGRHWGSSGSGLWISTTRP